jgi:FHA domain/Type II secretion system (T2SS), protein E, N-terminal domain/Type II/IV secretion system protein
VIVKSAMHNKAAESAIHAALPEPADLVVMHNKAIVTVFRLSGKRIVIGRSPDTDLCLDSRYVSWKHAVIDFDRSRAFVTDLCSRNCTLVNDKEIDKAVLSNGDIISIGLYTILYHVRGGNNPQIVASNDRIESADAYRILYETISQDPEMLIADADTVDVDEERLDTYGIDESFLPQPDAGEKTANPLRSFKIGSAAAATDSRDDNVQCDSMPTDKVLSLENIEAAARIAESEKRETLDVLEEKSGLALQLLTAELARVFEFRTVPIQEFMQMTPDFEMLSIAEARDRQCVIVRNDRRNLAIFCNPFDANLRPWLESRVPVVLDWALVSRGDLRAFISRHEQTMRAMDSAVRSADGHDHSGADQEDLSLASISKDSSPVVRLVHSTLYDALKASASDIHLEAGSAGLEIRYRLDGVLVHVATVNGVEIAEQVISRIKVMSELDIAPTRAARSIFVCQSCRVHLARTPCCVYWTSRRSPIK